MIRHYERISSRRLLRRKVRTLITQDLPQKLRAVPTEGLRQPYVVEGLRQPYVVEGLRQPYVVAGPHRGYAHKDTADAVATAALLNERGQQVRRLLVEGHAGLDLHGLGKRGHPHLRVLSHELVPRRLGGTARQVGRGYHIAGLVALVELSRAVELVQLVANLPALLDLGFGGISLRLSSFLADR